MKFFFVVIYITIVMATVSHGSNNNFQRSRFDGGWIEGGWYSNTGSRSSSQSASVPNTPLFGSAGMSKIGSTTIRSTNSGETINSNNQSFGVPDSTYKNALEVTSEDFNKWTYTCKEFPGYGCQTNGKGISAVLLVSDGVSVVCRRLGEPSKQFDTSIMMFDRVNDRRSDFSY